MRSIKSLIAGLAMALLVTTGAFAGSDLNEVGAALVFPLVISLDESGIIPGNAGDMQYETYATITNASTEPVFVHISLINGDTVDLEYCYECDFTIPLSGNDTEMLVMRNDGVGGTVIEAEPDGPDDVNGNGSNYFQHSCPISFGMLVATLEDAAGNAVTDNVLLGEEVLVNYEDGWALSVPAVTLQGQNGGDGNRKFGFDDVEYGKLPRIVATDFIAPSQVGPGRVRADVALFTLNFRRQFPPFVDCSVTGFDADENPFSRSIQFGCWDIFELEDISPEFLQENLGLFGQGDTHGWMQLNCETEHGYTGALANGGVHGAIMQRIANRSTVRRNDDEAPPMPAGESAAFGRLLFQSVTTGDAVTLDLEDEANTVGGLF